MANRVVVNVLKSELSWKGPPNLVWYVSKVELRVRSTCVPASGSAENFPLGTLVL